MLFEMLQLNQPTTIVLSIAIMLCCGWLMTRITKLFRLPNVTGYILSGILIGPYVLHLIPDQVIGGMEFITDVALAFIAFGVGRYFKLSVLKKSGKSVIIITLLEALIAAALIAFTMLFVFHLPLSFSLLLGAIGSATAPASTIMTIRQYKAKGRFVNTILQVVALDDAVALIAFSICAAIAQSLTSAGNITPSVVLLPILSNIFAIALGFGLAFVLKRIINERRSKDSRLIVLVTVILALTGCCSALDVSPLLSCMALGACYINITGNKALFKQLNKFTPPILELFFVLSGLRLDVSSLVTAGVIGVTYFFVRILGKYLGAWLGALLGRSPKEIRHYLGLALIPQAGVSIGLAVLGQRILPSEMGTMLSTIILSSGVLYEMVGPACAKFSLFLSHSIPSEVQSEPKKEKLFSSQDVDLEDMDVSPEGIQHSLENLSEQEMEPISSIAPSISSH